MHTKISCSMHLIYTMKRKDTYALFNILREHTVHIHTHHLLLMVYEYPIFTFGSNSLILIFFLYAILID